MSTLLPATEHRGEFPNRVRNTRDLALQRLEEIQSNDGAWRLSLSPNGLTAATFIILLRTTGLIEQTGQFELERKLLSGAARWTNSDGGFWKYPASPSSRCITRIFMMALRLVRGEVEPGLRPASWYQHNPLLEDTLNLELRRIADRARHFLAHNQIETSWQFDLDLCILTPLLVAHADVTRLLPRIISTLPRLKRPNHAMHFLWHAAWPALNILSAAPGENRFEHFVAQMRSMQDSAGAWGISSIITMINIMALIKAGVSLDDAAVRKGHACLVCNFLSDQESGPALVAWRSHIADTGYGLDSCLRARSSGSWKQAIEFLLSAQSSEGGFGWGTSNEDADSDTTAHVLRGFPQAALLAPIELRTQILESLRRGVKFMLARQTPDGGFSCWRPTQIMGRRGSLPAWRQLLFDMPTADVTGRIVETLAFAGYDAHHPAIRKALGFLLKTQDRSGGWWSRWWPGYLVGASFVMRAFGALGLRHDRKPPANDSLLLRSSKAMARASEFIIQHQNADGGWGETIRSDEDACYAGQGNSSPLYTALVAGALLRTGYPAGSTVIEQAIRHLLLTISAEGCWKDDLSYLTIFARCHYIRYDFLTHVLPLDALTDYLEALKVAQGTCDGNYGMS